MVNPFRGEPEGPEATKEFVEYVERLRDGHPHLNHWHIGLEADRVLFVNLHTHVMFMTTKFQLFEFWPEKVKELEAEQDEKHKTRIHDTGHHED